MGPQFWLDDLDALRSGAALVECAGDLLELAGADRLRLLQGLVTADVKTVAVGSATSGFFTTGQGRILADFILLAGAERSWLHLPRGLGGELRRHLEKYRVAARVEISEVLGAQLFALRGPRSKALAPASQAESTFCSAEGARFELAPAAAGVASQDGADRFVQAGFRRVGSEAIEIARIEDGELRFGVDFGGENFPQETGREAAVSYTKGCYLGQEVVARIHYRGGVQRLPRGLRLPAATPSLGAELRLEGRPAGRLTSFAKSPRFGPIGLAVLHQRAAAAGTRLEVEGAAGEAEVVVLPFGSTDEGAAG